VVTPRLIYCADGNARFADIAIKHGFTYGAQLPNTIYHQPGFVDQDWLRPDYGKYMTCLEQYRPALASVLDWEYPDQLPEVMKWAETAARFVTEAVIIIPKVPGGIAQLPREICGKQVRLGFSVQVKKAKSKFSGTGVPLREFSGWPIHILGGSPQKQYELAHKGLDAHSVDGNYFRGQANAGRFYAPFIGKAVKSFNKYFPQLKEAGMGDIDHDVPYHAFALSCINIRAMWQGSTCGIRYAQLFDLPDIKAICNQYKRKGHEELPFVNTAALSESIDRFELHVALKDGQVVGFVNWHARRDGWSTVREIAVHRDYLCQGIGKALLCAVTGQKRAKCVADNAANGFFQHESFNLSGVEPGLKRPLNIWERQAAS
jgi:N-acetylglutamate synthase-like GNAT family acetyltransferase